MKRKLVAIGFAVCAMVASTALADTTYRVQAGDTNWGIIAFRNETTVRELLRANVGRTRVRECREGERGMWSVSSRCRVHFVKVGDVLAIPDSRAELVERNATLLAERDRARAETAQKQADIDAMGARLREAATEIATLRTAVARLTQENAQLQTARTDTEGGMGLGWTIFAVIPLLIFIVVLWNAKNSVSGKLEELNLELLKTDEERENALASVRAREQNLTSRELAVKEAEKRLAGVAWKETLVKGLEEENSTRERDLKSGLEQLRRDRQKLADAQVAHANSTAELERDRERLRPIIVAEVEKQIDDQVRAGYEERERQLQESWEILTRERQQSNAERSELAKMRAELEAEKGRKRHDTSPMASVVVADARPSDEAVSSDSGVRPVQDPSSEVTRRVAAIDPCEPAGIVEDGHIVCNCKARLDAGSWEGHKSVQHGKCLACGEVILMHKFKHHQKRCPAVRQTLPPKESSGN